MWTLRNILPRWDHFAGYDKTLQFLLDHPRRCYTNLFPSAHTYWLLFSVVTLNSIDWIAFEVLNVSNLLSISSFLMRLPLQIGNDAVSSLPSGARVLDGLFQAFAVRSGGFYIVNIATLRVGLQVLYVIMMYISAFPVLITIRNSNVYEERSLGLYAEDLGGDDGSSSFPNQSDAEKTGPPQVFATLRRQVTDAPRRLSIPSYFVSQQLRAQLAHDLWWIVLAVLFITITETGSIEADPVNFSVFAIVFEVVSAYGCVGISLGLPNENYSFSGGWHVLSKLIMCAVMLRGRHRGLPVAIDRAVLLPGEEWTEAEEMDARIRMDGPSRGKMMRRTTETAVRGASEIV